MPLRAFARSLTMRPIKCLTSRTIILPCYPVISNVYVLAKLREVGVTRCRAIAALFAFAFTLQGCASSNHTRGAQGDAARIEDYSWLSASIETNVDDRSSIFKKYELRTSANEKEIRKKLEIRGVHYPESVKANCIDVKECWIARSLAFIGQVSTQKKSMTCSSIFFQSGQRSMFN